MSLPVYDFPREDDLARTALFCVDLQPPPRWAVVSEQKLRAKSSEMAPVSNPEKDMDGSDGGECLFYVAC